MYAVQRRRLRLISTARGCTQRLSRICRAAVRQTSQDAIEPVLAAMSRERVGIRRMAGRVEGAAQKGCLWVIRGPRGVGRHDGKAAMSPRQRNQSRLVSPVLLSLENL